MKIYERHFYDLRCSPDVLATVGFVANIQKEITESMGMIRKLKRFALARPNEYGLIDLCAGNALTSVLAIHLLPFKWAMAIDNKPREREWDRAKRFAYQVDDIMDPHVLDVLLPQLSPYVIVSVHACGQLAERAIELYQNTEAARHLVLMPCCEGIGKNRVPLVIRKKIGHYLAWAWHLNDLAGGKLYVDKNVTSPKRAIIVASKE